MLPCHICNSGRMTGHLITRCSKHAANMQQIAAANSCSKHARAHPCSTTSHCRQSEHSWGIFWSEAKWWLRLSKAAKSRIVTPIACHRQPHSGKLSTIPWKIHMSCHFSVDLHLLWFYIHLYTVCLCKCKQYQTMMQSISLLHRKRLQFAWWTDRHAAPLPSKEGRKYCPRVELSLRERTHTHTVTRRRSSSQKKLWESGQPVRISQ